MVSSKVMTNAAAHSHHSRRSIRRKLVRTTVVCPPVCALRGWTTVFGCRDRNNHPLAPTFPHTLMRARASDLGAFCGCSSSPPFLHETHQAARGFLAPLPSKVLKLHTIAIL
jgi:hypothetical protein